MSAETALARELVAWLDDLDAFHQGRTGELGERWWETAGYLALMERKTALLERLEAAKANGVPVFGGR